MITAVDPIVLQIVEGTLASIEAEVEAAIERTARSPMIRDQHDYRAGIHDNRCRKLTGRSYSAMVQPVVRDFPLEVMREGDVFYHNDVYLSEGSVGHLPDLTTTVPVFHQGRVVAFVQAFGHHDDIGGMVPGSMPAHATSAYQEGLMIPPVRLFSQGVRNDDLYRVIVRNSRTPESFAGDLDSEVAACRMGAGRLTGLFEKFGAEVVEACFQAVIDRCAESFRREVLARIPDGSYSFEDYIEHDGVEEPRLHVLHMTMTKTPEKIVCDLTGTGPQALGPINHAGDYAEGLFLRKWIACILRNLAETPERAAELDINEGICEVVEMVFPPRGTLVSPVFPAPTNARSFLILRLLGVFAGCLAQAVGGGCRPTRRRSATGASTALTPTAAGTCFERSSVGVQAAAGTPMGPTPSTSFPTPRTSPPSSPRPASRSGSKSLPSRPTPAALASGGAASAMTSTSASSAMPSSSPPPTARSSDPTVWPGVWPHCHTRRPSMAGILCRG